MQSSDERRFSRRCLLAAVILHVFVHLGTALNRHEISKDDGWAIVGFTAHLGEYALMVDSKQPPYGRWVPASDWKAFMRAKPSAAPNHPAQNTETEFKRIAYEQVHYDIHPPLYFWLAHIVSILFGTSLPRILALNLLLDTISIFVVFLLGRAAFGRERDAAIAALLWSLSPGVLTAAVQARHYSLYGLVSGLFCAHVLHMTAHGRRFRAIDVVVCFSLCMIGILTHYQFCLVMAGAAFVLVREFGRSERTRFLALIAAMVGGTAVVLLFVLPDWLVSLKQQQHLAQPFSIGALGLRLLTILGATGNFFVPGLVLRVVWGIALGIITVAILIRRRPIPWLRDAFWPNAPSMRRAFILGFFLFGAQAIAYMFFMSHRASMFQRYSAPWYPVFACMLVTVINASPWPRRLLRVTLVILTGGALGMGVNAILEGRAIETSLTSVRKADRVLIDAAGRGPVTELLWNVPDDTLVFIAHRQDMIREPKSWIEPLTDHSLWVKEPIPTQEKEGEDLHRILSERFELERVQLAVFRGRDVYHLRSKHR